MKWTRLATATLFVAAVPALAQRVPVRISRPAPEQTVRGEVPISINAAAVPPDGYMTVEIQPSGENLATFMSAVSPEPGAKAVTFVWDSVSKFADSDAPPRDGQYTIRVKTYSTAGNRYEFVRSNELNVYLRNRISIPATKTINLKYRYQPDQEFHFNLTKTTSAGGVTSEEVQAPLTITIEDVDSSGALATERADKSATVTTSGTVAPLARAGTTYSFTWKPTGTTVPGKKMKGNGFVPLFTPAGVPGRPVHLGDTWTSSFGYQSQNASGQPTTISKPYTNRFASLEYFRGQPAAKIIGDIDVQDAGLSISGSRVAYFDYIHGKLIRMESDLTVTQSATTGGAPGPSATGTAPTKIVEVTSAQ